MTRTTSTNDAPRTLTVATVAIVAVIAWSAWKPFDLATWFMEVVPVLVVLPLLWATRRSFPLSPLLYTLVALHAAVLAVGGYYSYARVPAIAAREILLRKTPLRARGWLFTLVTATCPAISALYEPIEWGAAMALGQGADEFLATQGDPWDTQKDMLMAWIGAMLAQGLLARWHDPQLAGLAAARP